MIPLTGKIFVFGSNIAGRHTEGAALQAYNDYGARYGQGEGLQGRSYAIPTYDIDSKTLPLGVIKEHVRDFLDYAARRSDLVFNVPPIDCGYLPEEFAPLFAGHIPKNVLLPESFKETLRLNG